MTVKKKFHVYGKMTASKYLGVFEAASEEEAVDMALSSDKNHTFLCHQCSYEIDLDDSSFSDADAEEERA